MSRLIHHVAISFAAVATALISVSAGAQEAATSSEAAATAVETVDPEAMKAVDRMAAYLRTLKSFEIGINFTTETALDDGQKLMFGGTSNYLVTRPNSLALEVDTDRVQRKFYFNGSTLTMFAPRMNVYTQVSAPGTIGHMFDTAFQKYGITLPLVDLFNWGSDEDSTHKPQSAMVVGFAKMGNVAVDQYAFREDNIDYQIWIQRGEQPLPLKMVITAADDTDRPQYVANLKWNLSPTIPADAFTFKPPAGASLIKAVEVEVVEESAQ